MILLKAADCPAKKIEQFPYRGEPLPVKEVWIQWVSQAGPAESPEYGLRVFTVGPGGKIPIHNHLYYQTMYILTGRLLMTSYDIETDTKTEEKEIGPGEVAFIPTMEPHSISNLSKTEAATFLCCIANVYEDEEVGG
jgi:quercetin dioxygenase-like cupin family protein